MLIERLLIFCNKVFTGTNENFRVEEEVVGAFQRKLLQEDVAVSSRRACGGGSGDTLLLLPQLSFARCRVRRK